MCQPRRPPCRRRRRCPSRPRRPRCTATTTTIPTTTTTAPASSVPGSATTTTTTSPSSTIPVGSSTFEHLGPLRAGPRFRTIAEVSIGTTRVRKGRENVWSVNIAVRRWPATARARANTAGTCSGRCPSPTILSNQRRHLPPPQEWLSPATDSGRRLPAPPLPAAARRSGSAIARRPPRPRLRMARRPPRPQLRYRPPAAPPSAPYRPPAAPPSAPYGPAPGAGARPAPYGPPPAPPQLGPPRSSMGRRRRAARLPRMARRPDAEPVSPFGTPVPVFHPSGPVGARPRTTFLLPRPAVASGHPGDGWSSP